MYTIQAVSNTAPRQWQNKSGVQMSSYKVRVQGSDEVLEFSKPSNQQPPLTGDTVDGTIQRNAYGAKLYPNFERKQKSNFQRDDSAIRAQWAIGKAVEVVIANGQSDSPDTLHAVESLAGDFYKMIARVKNIGEPARVTNQPPEPTNVPFEDFDKPLDINEIPF